MPFDGLSFSNLGLQRVITPMEVASMAEQTAKIQAAETIKKPEESQKSKTSMGEEDKESKNYASKEDDDNETDENETLDLSKNEDKQKALKKYRVKFNQITDMVELVDYKTGLVVETISPTDLMGLISKTSSSSGILVDREV